MGRTRRHDRALPGVRAPGAIRGCERSAGREPGRPARAAARNARPLAPPMDRRPGGRVGGLLMARVAAWRLGAIAVIGGTLGVGCTPRADLGSDLRWISDFEVGSFQEWSSQPGGAANSDPSPNAIEISGEQTHRG